MLHLIFVIAGVSFFTWFFSCRSTTTLSVLLLMFICLFIYLFINWDDVELITARGGGLFGVILMMVTPVFITGILISRACKKR